MCGGVHYGRLRDLSLWRGGLVAEVLHVWWSTLWGGGRSGCCMSFENSQVPAGNRLNCTEERTCQRFDQDPLVFFRAKKHWQSFFQPI